MKNTVFILGAGATRGCSFVNDMKRHGHCLPPLDTDFFTQLQRVSNKNHSPRINRLIKGLVAWFGPNYSLGMEQVFCHLEHAERMLKHLGREASDEYKSVTSLKQDLEQTIAIILGESLTQVKEGGKGSYSLRECKWHDLLVEKLTSRGDSIITFNYDCVVDDSLRRKGHGKWNPHYGYGIKLKPSGPAIQGEKNWAPMTGGSVSRDDSIRVHKIHGSLHFRKNGQDIEMKQRPYANPKGKSGNMKFNIIAPESSKHYEAHVFGKFMQDAYQSLKKAKRVVAIGYSLPQSDQHAESLFRFGIKKSTLDSLVIVNPDKTARARIRGALLMGLKPSTRVLSFDYLEEFAQAEPSIWKI